MLTMGASKDRALSFERGAAMATGKDLDRLALALEGTTAAPHFDRTAYKVKRTYATLSADKRSANLKLTPDEQAFKTLLAPEAFQPVANKWGEQGWTTVMLARLSVAELEAALAMAWAHALPRPRTRRAAAPRTQASELKPRAAKATEKKARKRT